MSNDLINIKDKYGEGMMHLCRKNFSTILETEGLLFGLLSSHFAYSRFLYDDIVNNSIEMMFKNFIYSLLVSKDEELPVSSKTTSQLLSEAGYNLYECFNEDDIQSYRKYYASSELLCSFCGGRLDECYVFFAIKKDVDKIRREDFINPLRQDKYGTSVISIQFTKGDVNTLSIKNRYNHTVTNPDATYSNNLENIIPGLTRSFERDYNLHINQNCYGLFEIPGYVLANDGKYYKYNYEINNIYYCTDNIIIDNFEVIRDYQQKEKYIIIDYFIIDLVNKKISLYDKNINDSFVDGLNNIRKIEINKDKKTGNKRLDITFVDGCVAFIEIDKFNRIISYENENVLEVEDNFLYKNMYLQNIEIPNVIRICDNFLSCNVCIKEIVFNKLLTVGTGFLSCNKIIDQLQLDNVMMIGDCFLSENTDLVNINMSNLEKVGENFLEKNKIITEVNLYNLMHAGNNFLRYNMSLEKISLPVLEYVGSNFMAANKILKEIYLPQLLEVKDNFLYSNLEIENVYLSNLRTIGNNFMCCNRKLKEIDLSRLNTVGMKFLYKNNSIEKLELPELVNSGRYFMFNNNSLKILLVLKLRKVGDYFLVGNNVLEYVEIDGNIKCFDSMCSKKKILKI